MADADPGRRGFIAGLGVAQIVSWGTLYYSFPLIAGPMAQALELDKLQVYGAASIGLASGGLSAYPVGRLVDAGHGRAVMTAGAAFGALMLLCWSRMASATWLVPLFVGIGIAQAASLYEPAFAVISRRAQPDAREAITRLTLWGGFASTVFVPVTQALLDHLPWRDALVVLAVLQLLIGAMLNWRVIGAADARAPAATYGASKTDPAVAHALAHPVFWALLAAFTLYYAAFSALTLHLYPLLSERGLSASVVVLTLGAIGPAQVLGRILIWKTASSARIRHVGPATLAVLCASLLILRGASSSVLALLLFAVIFGAANGVMTIVRGLAVPELLSRRAYGAINGLLAAPATIAKAVAPVMAAWLWSVDADYALVLDVVTAGAALAFVCFGIAAWVCAVPVIDPSTENLNPES